MSILSKTTATIIAVALTFNIFAAEDKKDPSDKRKAGEKLSVKPDPETIREWRSLKYGMFISYGMSTFTGNAHQKTKVDPAQYAPTQLDVEQWVRVARDAGMKYIVLTAKHTAGHCLWDSRVKWRGQEFDYDVAQGKNKTDVVGAFVKACRKHKIKPALYYCFEDYVNNSNYRKGGPGRKARSMPDDYYELVKHQLAELLNLYPDVEYIWLDIPTQGTLNQRTDIYNMIKEINKDCLVLYNWGWGKGAETIAETAVKTWPRDILNTELRPLKTGQFRPQQTYQGRTYNLGYEHCDDIAEYWFWKPADAKRKQRPVSDLVRLYDQVRDAGGNLLLNVPPDRTGQIPEYFVRTLMALRKALDSRPTNPR